MRYCFVQSETDRDHRDPGDSFTRLIAGFRSRVARSTLADANRVRDWRIYADFAHILFEQARRLYAADDFGLALEQTVDALDSTTIELCLSLFSWATFRRRKAAIKLHALIDLQGNIPTFVPISPGKRHTDGGYQFRETISDRWRPAEWRESRY
ncbi:hypothetical protein BH23PLA1_BH23PLA1_14110 [soil metagenome]